MELAAAASTAPGRTTYSVINLSPLDIFSTADINAKGQVAFDVFRQAGVGIGKFYDGKTVLDTGLIFVSALNDRGQVVGSANVPETGALHDIGEGGFANDLNDKGMVVGVETISGQDRAFAWTRGTGVIYLGTFGGASSVAVRVNNRGHVVGSAQAPDGARAFVWSRADGLVDLNTRIPDAPAGLLLTFARAISDNGAIVASSNAGLVLLVPRPFAHAAPVVGPVNVTGMSRINATQSFSAIFKDADLRDTHKATWSWGDGSKDAGTVSEGNGIGSVSSQHTYRAPGIYTVRLTVTDSSGTSATVQRTVVVCSGSLSPT